MGWDQAVNSLAKGLLSLLLNTFKQPAVFQQLLCEPCRPVPCDAVRAETMSWWGRFWKTELCEVSPAGALMELHNAIAEASSSKKKNNRKLWKNPAMKSYTAKGCPCRQMFRDITILNRVFCHATKVQNKGGVLPINACCHMSFCGALDHSRHKIKSSCYSYLKGASRSSQIALTQPWTTPINRANKLCQP